MKFYPYEKRGGRVVLAMEWGEHDKFWGSFKIHVKQKGGGEGVTFYPFLGGGLR